MANYSLGNTIKVFTLLVGMFYLGFFWLCLLWTQREIKELRNIFGAMMISLLTTFKLMMLGVALILLFFAVLYFGFGMEI